MKLKIISDGTNAGTKLFDEDSGDMVHFIQKLIWKATTDDFLVRTSVGLVNVPVDITTIAEIQLIKLPCNENDISTWETTQVINKKVRVISEGSGYSAHNIKILDADTNITIGTVQDICFEATPDSVKLKITMIDPESLKLCQT